MVAQVTVGLRTTFHGRDMRLLVLELVVLATRQLAGAATLLDAVRLMGLALVDAAAAVAILAAIVRGCGDRACDQTDGSQGNC